MGKYSKVIKESTSRGSRRRLTSPVKALRPMNAWSATTGAKEESMFMSLTRLMGGVVLLAAVLALPGCGYNDLQGLDEVTKAAWWEGITQY